MVIPEQLSELAAFTAVARHLSFRRAALERGVSPSALSHAIRALEARLGVRLFNRTTRSVALTEAGAQLFARLQPAFGDIQEALQAASQLRDTPAGLLRLNVPRSAAALLLAPIVAEVVKRHPGLRVEVVTDDALVDIVAGGFDAGIRFGEQLMRDMVAVRLGPEMRLAVVASPAYLAQHGRPAKPQDLHDHLCIRRRFPSGAIYRWELERRGKQLQVDVQGPLTLDDSSMILQCAAAGAGIAMVFEKEALPLLSSGALARVLEDWCPAFPGMFLYYPSRRHMPAGLRAFISTARELSGRTAA